MVTKIVKTQVEFPECGVCYNLIFEGDKIFNISIKLSKMTVGPRGGSQGPSTGNFSGKPLLLCENCFSNNEMDPIVKLRIIQELERQFRIFNNQTKI